MLAKTKLSGFDKILEDKKNILSCFKEMLSNIEENNLSDFIESLNENDTYDGISDEKIIQSFGMYFQLMNLIEENAAIQFNREFEKNYGIAAIRGSWGETFKLWNEQGIDQDEMVNTIASIHICPVLTAHPTEAKGLRYWKRTGNCICYWCKMKIRPIHQQRKMLFEIKSSAYWSVGGERVRSIWKNPIYGMNGLMLYII